MKNIARKKIVWLILAVIATTAVIALLYWHVIQRGGSNGAEDSTATSTIPEWRTDGDIELPSETYVPVADRLTKSDIKVGNVVRVPSKVIGESGPEDLYINLRIVSVRHVTNAEPYVDHVVFEGCNLGLLTNISALSCGIFVVNNSGQLAMLRSTNSGLLLNTDEDETQQLQASLDQEIKRDELNSKEYLPITIDLRAYPYMYLNVETGEATSYSADDLIGYDVDHLSTNTAYSSPLEYKRMASSKTGAAVDRGEGEPGWYALRSVSLYTQDSLAHTITVEVEYATSTPQARIVYATSEDIGLEVKSEKILATITDFSLQHPAIGISYDLLSLSHSVDLKIDTATYTFNFDTETLTRKN